MFRVSRLFCWSLLLSGLAFGLDSDRTLTQYVHRIWQTQQGLPQASISAIWQDRDGYLWLGTQSGLLRFDGVRFTPLENIYPNAPTNVWVREVIEDKNRTRWIATNDAGLFRLAGGAATRFSQKDGFPSDTVSCLVQTPNGDVWACTADGMVRFRGDQSQTYRMPEGLSTNNIADGCQAADGTLWVAGDNPKLNAWNGTKFVTRQLTSVPADSRIRSLICSDGGFWIGTNVGLVRWKDGHEHLFTVKDGLADNSIFAISEGHDGNLWIGTRNGFSRLRNGEIESFRPQDGLSQSTVYSLYEDREGSLWVGTKHGLNQFLDGRAVPYTAGEGLPSNDTGPVVQDDRGNIWVGTLGDGLSRFVGHRFKAISRETGLSTGMIHALLPEPNGILWVGTDRGLTRLRDGQVERTYSTAEGLPSNTVRSLFRDHTGTFWAGTSSGLAELTGDRFTQPEALRKEPRETILSISDDKTGRLFYSTERGVFFYSSGKIRELTQEGIPLRSVNAFFRNEDGLWIPLSGAGLRLLDGDKLYSFFSRDGLFDNDIYGIVRDHEDRFWMACSKGIFSVPHSELMRFAKGEVKKLTSSPYSPTDALRVIESKPGVQPAISFMRDGRVWFSTIRGLIALDPNLVVKVPPLPVVIEEVTVNGESQSPGTLGNLAPSRNNLEFRYTGLSYVLTNRITFKYTLEGYDKGWVEAGNRREAFYTNLPPGQFRFRVIGCNIDNTCNEAATSVPFVVEPHLYQRSWFFPLCAVILGLSGWLVYQLRIRHLREQFSLILAERNRIARELHDTLIQGLSGITMEMQALSGRLRSEDDKNALQDIIGDAGLCLRETRRSVAGLRGPQQGSSHSGLCAAIEQAARQITEAKDIRLKLKLQPGPKGLPADVEYNLVRIAQEAVTNSVKHSGARNVEVALNHTREQVSLSVRDDGSGFAREGNGRSGHYGLIGMKERATHIGADLQFASEPGRGTTVSVLLPAEKNGSHHTK